MVKTLNLVHFKIFFLSVWAFLCSQYNCMGWALYVQPQSIAIPTIAHNTIQGIINHTHLGRFQLTTTGVYGFLWVNPAVWNSTVLQEAQSIWQISLLTDGVLSIQQSICCILIPSHVYSRIWTQNASVLRLRWLFYSISVLQLCLLPSFLLHLFSPAWYDFLVICTYATISFLEGAVGYAPTSSCRAAKSSNQTRHPSLSCGVE